MMRKRLASGTIPPGIVYNRIMYIQNPQAPQPILSIMPKTLDFGIVSAENPVEGKGIAKLQITNDGERILVGRIAIQVAWVSVFPPDFRLNPGETSEHFFTVKHDPQMSWTSHRLGSEFIALINSNGGSETVGGFYFSDATTKAPKKSPIRTWMYVLLPVLLLLTGLLLFFLKQQDSIGLTAQETSNSDALYTQIAETYFAGLELTPFLPTEIPTLIHTVNPMEVAGPDLGPTAEPTMTFTPWVAAEFPNVEEFIRSYYDVLAQSDYDKAWWMLTEKMQRACCSSGQGTPKEIYQRYWETVSWVDVDYAFLQAYDTNPAEVNVGLLYHYKDGTTEESVNRFSIISDDLRKTLLIDEIR